MTSKKTNYSNGVVVGSTQKNAKIGPLTGVSPCICAAMGLGGGQTPLIVIVKEK